MAPGRTRGKEGEPFPTLKGIYFKKLINFNANYQINQNYLIEREGSVL
jgi:hypothetical protein